jgi:peptide/nickel transport system permease protein
MLSYIIRRLLYMIPTVLVISIISFVIIQLPPGDYLTSMVAGMAERGEEIDAATIEALRARYGLGEPVYVQYYKWMRGILLRGDFGQSFEWSRPVKDIIWERLGWTLVISVCTVLFIWVLAFPIGIYSAVRKYSVGDYVATFIGFVGVATPGFLLALVLMYIAFSQFGQTVGGLFSPKYLDEAWSWGKFWDLLSHLWVPLVILGTSGTASLIRRMRANMLDELHKPYVLTAKAKGLSEWKAIIKYPVRVALNPFISTIGWELPKIVSGSQVVGIVLSLPVTGPLLLRALKAQDMYLAGSFIMMISVLTVIGTLISDLLLAWFDPRIRYQ